MSRRKRNRKDRPRSRRPSAGHRAARARIAEALNARGVAVTVDPSGHVHATVDGWLLRVVARDGRLVAEFGLERTFDRWLNSTDFIAVLEPDGCPGALFDAMSDLDENAVSEDGSRCVKVFT